MNRSNILQRVNLNRRRAAPMIVPALLGAVILSDVTPVSGSIANPLTPTPMPLASNLPVRNGPTGMLAAAAQMAPPAQNHAARRRWLVLTGIIAFTDPKQGFVIIGNSVENTSLARPSQRLPDGSWIREIHPKHVVLEYEGSLETVGMYQHEQSAGTAYVPLPPPSQQARSEEAQLRGTMIGDTTPSQAPRPVEPAAGGWQQILNIRPNETPANQVLSQETPPGGARPEQVQPQAPLSPTTQDPADEFGDLRRQRAENGSK